MPFPLQRVRRLGSVIALKLKEVLTMALIDIAVALIVIGFVLWLTNSRALIPPSGRRIVNVILGLIVVGMLLWLVNTYVPMAGTIRGLLSIVVVVASCIWVLQAFGVWDEIVRSWHEFTRRRTPPERISPPASRPVEPVWPSKHM